MSKAVAALLSVLLAVMPCMAQQQTTPASKLPVPAGTNLSVVLTEQISSTSTHPGDQVHLQLVSPVVSGAQVAIPAGTYLQGRVNTISQEGDIVSLSIYSASLAFANGYVVRLAGPVELRSSEGWWTPSPNSHRGAVLIPLLLAPAVGGVIGAAAGRDGSLTPGSISGGQLTPGTLTPSTRGRDAAIGLGIGSGIAVVGLIAYWVSHRHGPPDFFYPAGTPANAVLSSAVFIDPDQSADAASRTVVIQPLAPRPIVREVDPFPSPSGICHGPDIPGTPDTVIPGIPANPDSPGTPDTVIPGTPAIPGPPIPCS